MAKLTNCATCDHEVSSAAKVCPSCGGKVRKSNAGKLFLVLLVAMGVLGFMVFNPPEPASHRSTGVTFQAPIVAITRIAGRPQAEVSVYMGAPSNCEKVRLGTKCYYEKGTTDILFIDEKADWITVMDLGPATFSKDALSALGLKISNPTFGNATVLRWEPIQGLRSVSLFPGALPGQVDYAYIRARTE